MSGLWDGGYFVLFCLTFFSIKSSFMSAILVKLFLMKSNSSDDCKPDGIKFCNWAEVERYKDMEEELKTGETL